MIHYVWLVLKALDVLVLNVLLSPLWNMLSGSNDFGQLETLSDAMGERIRSDKASGFEVWLCRRLSMIDWQDEKHCISSIIEDDILNESNKWRK